MHTANSILNHTPSPFVIISTLTKQHTNHIATPPLTHPLTIMKSSTEQENAHTHTHAQHQTAKHTTHSTPQPITQCMRTLPHPHHPPSSHSPALSHVVQPLHTRMITRRILTHTINHSTQAVIRRSRSQHTTNTTHKHDNCCWSLSLSLLWPASYIMRHAQPLPELTSLSPAMSLPYWCCTQPEAHARQ